MRFNNVEMIASDSLRGRTASLFGWWNGYRFIITHEHKKR